MATAHFHIGPHETGSPEIGEFLRENGDLLRRSCGVTPVFSEAVRTAAAALNSGDAVLAQTSLGKLADICRRVDGDCLVSCEDLAGLLPGSRVGDQPYASLWENVSAIRAAFHDFDTRFYFFLRSADAWSASAYRNLPQHRDHLLTPEDYRAFLKPETLWDVVLTTVRGNLADGWNEIAQSEDVGLSPVTRLVQAVCGKEAARTLRGTAPGTTDAADEATRKLLDLIKRSQASAHARREAVRWVGRNPKVPQMDSDGLDLPDWTARPGMPNWLAPDLQPLWKRVAARARSEKQPNLLPDPFCDLVAYRIEVPDSPETMPDVPRGKMQNQRQILSYRFRDRPMTCYLLALTISYLRRGTEHTEHAAYLFHRLWHEEYPILLALLPTRWLISTFQTFMDHGMNADQRLVGGAAFFYANVLKTYEAERALEGHAPDATYGSATPATPSGFHGLDRFNLGGSDIMLNTNALLLEYASRDDAVGRVVQEFLLRTKASATVFSRMDQSRILHKIDIKQFSGCWSFGDEPAPWPKG